MSTIKGILRKYVYYWNFSHKHLIVHIFLVSLYHCKFNLNFCNLRRFINFSKSCNGTSTMDANLVRELPKLQNFFQTNLLKTNLLILKLKLKLLVNRRQVQIQQPFQLQKTTQDNDEIVLIISMKLMFKQETAFIKKTFLRNLWTDKSFPVTTLPFQHIFS